MINQELLVLLVLLVRQISLRAHSSYCSSHWSTWLGDLWFELWAAVFEEVGPPMIFLKRDRMLRCHQLLLWNEFKVLNVRNSWVLLHHVFDLILAPSHHCTWDLPEFRLLIAIVHTGRPTDGIKNYKTIDKGGQAGPMTPVMLGYYCVIVVWNIFYTTV